MSDFVERVLDGLTVRIDRTLCVGFAQCVDTGVGAFRLDDDDVAEFDKPESVTRERVLQACEACPVEAIKVTDSTGAQLVP